MRPINFCFFLFIVICKNVNSQKVLFYSDSTSFKKEIFEYVISDKPYKRILRFKDYVNSYEDVIKYNDVVKEKLQNYFPLNVSKRIIDLKEIEYPRTSWLAVYNKNTPDSTTFIFDRHVDDFFYIQDSLRVKAHNENKVFTKIYLCSIYPVIFSVTENNIEKIYAIVSSYFQSKEGFFLGESGSIKFYERRKTGWILTETFSAWDH